MTKSSSAKTAQEPVGGLAFFFSLISLTFVSALLLFHVPIVVEPESIGGLAVATLALLVGGIAGRLAVFGRLKVFLHELKHSIVSNLSGNRAKKMTVGLREGSFRYEFTKETAHLNALIALAPYFFPLFSILGVTLAIALPYEHLVKAAVVGVAFGADLALNLRDISPIQTDLTEIRGGYSIALWYITVMNSSLGLLFLVWVARGFKGFSIILSSLLSFGTHLF